jgi:integrase
MEHIEDPGRRMLVLLALQTGLRRSELLGLQWRDVDLALSTLAVQRALIQLRTGRTELTSPKSGRVRVVALYSGTVEELRGYRAGLLPAPGAEDHVFLRPDGSPLEPGACDPVVQADGGAGGV